MNQEQICQKLRESFQRGREEYSNFSKKEKEIKQLEIDASVSQYTLGIAERKL